MIDLVLPYHTALFVTANFIACVHSSYLDGVFYCRVLSARLETDAADVNAPLTESLPVMFRVVTQVSRMCVCLCVGSLRLFCTVRYLCVVCSSCVSFVIPGQRNAIVAK